MAQTRCAVASRALIVLLCLAAAAAALTSPPPTREVYPTEVPRTYETSGLPPSIWKLDDPQTTGLLAVDSARRQIIRAFSGHTYVNNRYTQVLRIEAVSLVDNATVWTADDLGTCSKFIWIELVSKSLSSGADPSPVQPAPDTLLVACSTPELITIDAETGDLLDTTALTHTPPSAAGPGQTNILPNDFGTQIPRFGSMWINGRDYLAYFVTARYGSEYTMEVVHISSTGAPARPTTLACSGTNNRMLAFTVARLAFTDGSDDLKPAFVMQCYDEVTVYDAGNAFFDIVGTAETCITGGTYHPAPFTCKHNDTRIAVDAIGVDDKTGVFVAGRWNDELNVTEVLQFSFMNTRLVPTLVGSVDATPSSLYIDVGTVSTTLEKSGTPREMFFVRVNDSAPLLLVVQLYEERTVVATVQTSTASRPAVTDVAAQWMIDDYWLVATYDMLEGSRPYRLSPSRSAYTVVRGIQGFVTLVHRVNNIFVYQDPFDGSIVLAAYNNNCNNYRGLNYVLPPAGVQVTSDGSVGMMVCNGGVYGVDFSTSPLTGERSFGSVLGVSTSINSAVLASDLLLVDKSYALSAAPIGGRAFNWAGSAPTPSYTISDGVVFTFVNRDATATAKDGSVLWTAESLFSSGTLGDPVLIEQFAIQAVYPTEYVVVNQYSGEYVTTTSASTFTCMSNMFAETTALTKTSNGAFATAGACAVHIARTLQTRPVSSGILGQNSALLDIAPVLIGRPIDDVTPADPLEAGEQFVVYAMQSGVLVAVDVLTLDIAWSVEADEASDYGTHLRFATSGNILLVSTAGGITSRFVPTGEKLFRRDYPTIYSSNYIPIPFLYGNTAVVAASDVVYRYLLDIEYINGHDDGTTDLTEYGFKSYLTISATLSPAGLLFVAQGGTIVCISTADANSMPVGWNQTLAMPTSYYYTPQSYGIAVDPADPQLVFFAAGTSYHMSSTLLNTATGYPYYSTSTRTSYYSQSNAKVPQAVLSDRTAFLRLGGSAWHFASSSLITGPLLPLRPPQPVVAPPTNVTVPAGYEPPTQPPVTLPPIGPADTTGPPSPPPISWVQSTDSAATRSLPITDSHALAIVVPSSDLNFTVLNASTGELLWFEKLYCGYQNEIDFAVTMPTNASGVDEAVLVIACRTSIYGYSATSGVRLWSTSVDAQPYQLLARGNVFALLAYHTVYVKSVFTGGTMGYYAFFNRPSLTLTLVSNTSTSPFAQPSHLLIESDRYSEITLLAMEITPTVAELAWTRQTKNHYWQHHDMAQLPASNFIAVGTGRRSQYYDEVPINVTIIDLRSGDLVFVREYDNVELPNVTESPNILAVPRPLAQSSGIAFLLRSARGIAAFELDLDKPWTEPSQGDVRWQTNYTELPDDLLNGDTIYVEDALVAAAVPNDPSTALVFLSATARYEAGFVATLGLATGRFVWNTTLDASFTAQGQYSTAQLSMDPLDPVGQIIARVQIAMFILNSSTGAVIAGTRATSHDVGDEVAFVDTPVVQPDGSTAVRRGIVIGAAFGNSEVDIRCIEIDRAVRTKMWTAYTELVSEQAEVVLQYDSNVIIMNEPRLVCRNGVTGEVMWHALLPGAPFTGTSAVLHRMGSRIAIRRADRVVLFDAMLGTFLGSLLNRAMFAQCQPSSFYDTTFAVLSPGFVTDLTVTNTAIPSQPTGGHDVDGQVLLIVDTGCLFFINHALDVNAVRISFGQDLSNTIAFYTDKDFTQFVVVGGLGYVRGVTLPSSFVYPAAARARVPPMWAGREGEFRALGTPESWAIVNNEFRYQSLSIGLSRTPFVLLATGTHMWCVQATTGQIAWREGLSIFGRVHLPIVRVLDVVLIYSSTKLVAFNVSSSIIGDTDYMASRKLWSVDLPDTLNSYGSRPLVFADRYVVAAAGNELWSIEIDPEDPSKLPTFNRTDKLWHVRYSWWIDAGRVSMSECVGSYGDVPLVVVTFAHESRIINVLTNQTVAVTTATGVVSGASYGFIAQCYVAPATQTALVVSVVAPASSYGHFKGSVYVRQYDNASAWLRPALPPFPPLPPYSTQLLPSDYKFPWPKPTLPSTQPYLPSDTEGVVEPVSLWEGRQTNEYRVVGIFPLTTVYMYRTTTNILLEGVSNNNTAGPVVMWAWNVTDDLCPDTTYFYNAFTKRVTGGSYFTFQCSSSEHMFVIDAHEGALLADVTFFGTLYSGSNHPVVYFSDSGTLCAGPRDAWPSYHYRVACAVVGNFKQVTASDQPVAGVNATIEGPLCNTTFGHSSIGRMFPGWAGGRGHHARRILYTCDSEHTVVGMNPATGDVAFTYVRPPIVGTLESGSYCTNAWWFTSLVMPTADLADPLYSTVSHVGVMVCNYTHSFSVTLVNAATGHTHQHWLNMTSQIPTSTSRYYSCNSVRTYTAVPMGPPSSGGGSHRGDGIVLGYFSGKTVANFVLHANTPSSINSPIEPAWTVDKLSYRCTGGFQLLDADTALVYNSELNQMARVHVNNGTELWEKSLGYGPTPPFKQTTTFYDAAGQRYVWTRFAGDSYSEYVFNIETGMPVFGGTRGSYRDVQSDEIAGVQFQPDSRCIVVVYDGAVQCLLVSDRPWRRPTLQGYPQVFPVALKAAGEAGNVLVFDGGVLYWITPEDGNVTRYVEVLPSYRSNSNGCRLVGGANGKSTVVIASSEGYLWHVSTADGSLLGVDAVPIATLPDNFLKQTFDPKVFTVADDDANLYFIAGTRGGFSRVRLNVTGGSPQLSFVDTDSPVLSMDYWPSFEPSPGIVVFEASGIVTMYDVETLRKLWNVTVVLRTSSYDAKPTTIVTGDYVIVTDGGDQILAISLFTGQIGWIHNFNIGYYEATRLAVYNSTVVAFAGHDLLCLSLDIDRSSFAANVNRLSQVRWTMSLRAIASYYTANFGPFVTPNGIVVFGIGMVVMGVEAATGDVLWQTSLSSSVSSCDNDRVSIAGDKIFVPCRRLYVFDFNTGLQFGVIDDRTPYSVGYDRSSNRILVGAYRLLLGARPQFTVGADIAPLPVFPGPVGRPPASFPRGDASVVTVALPPAVTLPTLDCRVRVDLAVPVWRTCVDRLLAMSYNASSSLGSFVSFANCSAMATMLQQCKVAYLATMGDDCPGGVEFLEQRLDVLRASPVVRVCGGSATPDTCSDAGGQAKWCAAVANVGDIPDGIATMQPNSTVYPEFTWMPQTPHPFSAAPAPPGTPAPPLPPNDDEGNWTRPVIENLMNHTGYDTVHKLYGTYSSSGKWVYLGWTNTDTNGRSHSLVTEVYHSANVSNWEYIDVHAIDATDAYYTAGYAEGYLTFDRIYSTWNNQVAERQSKLLQDAGARDFVNEHIAYGKNHERQTALGQQVFNQMRQVQGLSDGWTAGYNAAGSPSNITAPLDYLSIYLISYLEELENILGKYRTELREPASVFTRNDLHCSALMKLTQHDFYFAHDTWTSFQSMLRQYKTYRLPAGPSNAIASVVMSSYPGSISSIDDWYMTSLGLAVTETTNGFANTSLYDLIKPNQISEFNRVMAANFLTNTPEAWMKIFATNNSGTYNNQYMVANMAEIYKYFTESGGGAPGAPLTIPPHSFYVGEQIPGLVVYADQTEFVNTHRHWPSYNVPFYPEIYNRSGFRAEDTAQYWGMHDYHEYARARIFKRMQGNVTDIASMYYMMRYNNYKDDRDSTIPWCKTPWTPKGVVDCGEEIQSGSQTIAARYDLNPPNWSWAPGRKVRIPYLMYGSIDTKLTSARMMANNALNAIAVNGPTHVQVPVFQHSAFVGANPSFKSVPWRGVADRFEFPPTMFAEPTNIATTTTTTSSSPTSTSTMPQTTTTTTTTAVVSTTTSTGPATTTVTPPPTTTTTVTTTTSPTSTVTSTSTPATTTTTTTPPPTTSRVPSVPLDNRFLLVFNRSNGPLPTLPDIAARVERLLTINRNTFHVEVYGADRETYTYEVSFYNPAEAARLRRELMRNEASVASSLGVSTVKPLAAAPPPGPPPGDSPATFDTNIIVYCVVGVVIVAAVAGFIVMRMRNHDRRTSRWGGDASSSRELSDRQVQLEEQLYDYDEA